MKSPYIARLLYRDARTSLACVLYASALFSQTGVSRAQETGNGAEYFSSHIQPLLKEYCLNCHSTEKQKGDLDLELFSTLETVKRHPKIWQGVAEQLANREMPPKNKPQPAPEQMERLSKWVSATLDEVARARAGDPGPVVLRRLSNAEYTYTLRDLTGLDSLEPAREFPVDGAAGEGFTNTGQALVMSPSLITKYLDAAKEIASHAVLLPDGIRFSTKTTRRDWTEELVTQIREVYREFTDPRSGEKVVQQGITMDRSNEAGQLPLERYLAATLEEREAITSGAKTAESVARERGLSPKYLATLIAALSSNEPSLLLNKLRTRWRTAKPADAAALAAEIAQWQKALWKFSSVGHIGKVGGPKAWMEPVNPIAEKQEIRFKLPPSPDGKDITLFLVATDAGDGSEKDYVAWERPRLVAPGRPDLLVRDIREVSRLQAKRRDEVFSSAAKCLNAAMEASAAQGNPDVAEIATRHGVKPEVLRAWIAYLGIGSSASIKLDSYLAGKMTNGGNYDFIRGWGVAETPNLVANSSDQHVRIPGNMKPHSVAVHPSPKLQAVVGWRAPVAATVRVEATVEHAHPECGNGVTWLLELRRGSTRQRLAAGTAQGSSEVRVPPIDGLAVQPGDLVSLLIGPRDGNHSCDLTRVDLVLTGSGESARTWSLAADISPDVLAGNPHADRFGNEGVWHFYTEPASGAGQESVIPSGSLLAKWLTASTAEEKWQLAGEVQQLLLSDPPSDKESPEAKLRQQLASFSGPLLARMRPVTRESGSAQSGSPKTSQGPDPAMFGRLPNGQPFDSPSLCVQAPSVVEIRIPADLAAGCEFVTTGRLEKVTGAEGSVQLQVLTAKPETVSGLLPSSTAVAVGKGAWTGNNQMVSVSTPIIVNEGSMARQRIDGAFHACRQLFPAALCYMKIVPVDEVVTLTLFHREDDHLVRLMLDDAQRAKLDRLWDELHYVSQDALTLVDALAQIIEFSTQDGDPKVFEPLRQPYNERAAAYRKRLLETEPQHLKAVIEFAGRAYRHPLTAGEERELRELYGKLRAQELPHEDAIRLTLARVLVSPAFLYRAETPGAGREQMAVNDWELASRLSYFLWSSMPDEELCAAAAAGKLHEPETLLAQTQRMLQDPRARRLATEFGCQWLHIHDFDTLDEKSERHFPTFGALRGAMYEESIRFFTDLFQRNGSVLSVLDADHTFLNEALAKHYGIPGVTGEEWQRVDGVKKFSRGGILGQAAVLAKQSGASRTSPILRGNWVAEVLLGDRLPRPPKDVPTLPEDEATETLTVRQLTEKHSSDPRCSGCHVRIDAFGFALESFDAIGRHRERDLADRLIDTRAKVLDGTEIEGLDGIRNYLLTKRRDAFLRQFSRKLLGYALGRGVQLSDEPLLAEMQKDLAGQDYRVGAAITKIVQSRQFREIRGREMTYED